MKAPPKNPAATVAASHNLLIVVVGIVLDDNARGSARHGAGLGFTNKFKFRVSCLFRAVQFGGWCPLHPKLARLEWRHLRGPAVLSALLAALAALALSHA